MQTFWRRAGGTFVVLFATAVLLDTVAGVRLAPATGLAVVASLAVATIGAAFGATRTPGVQRFRAEQLSTRRPPSWVRVRQLVRWSTTEPYQMSEQLFADLRLIAADRLRAAHGIDVWQEPLRAREVLGPRLYDLLALPAAPPGIGIDALETITKEISCL